MKEQKKVKIVGAGLSGLYTAKWLLNKNKNRKRFKIIIYESQKKDDYDINCGNGVINVREYLDHIRSDLVPHIRNEIKKSYWRFHIDNEVKNITIFFEDDFYLVDRLEWQLQLIQDVQNLGATIHFGVSKRPKEFKESCDICVDARGSLKGGNAIYSVCKLDNNDVSSKTAVLDFKPDLNGYFWMFPYGDSIANIGYGSLSDKVSKKKLKNYLSKYDVEKIFKIGGGKLNTSFGEKIYRNEDLAVKKDNIFKVGDRAGLCDSLTGEGIGGAILSAYTLSRLIKKGKLNKYEGYLEKQHGNLKYPYKFRKQFQQNYDKFAKKFLSLDGANGKYISTPLSLFIHHPIKAIKFFIK